MTTKTPHQRWLERTKDGRAMAGGWTHKRHTPPCAAQYEVRNHPNWSILTWGYGSWWNQDVDGLWHRIEGRYDWRGPYCDYCSVNWASVIVQAAEEGNEQAKMEIECIRSDRKRCTCCRSGYEGTRCPVHSP